MSVGLPSIACVHLVLILGQRLVFSYLQEYHIPKHLAWVYTSKGYTLTKRRWRTRAPETRSPITAPCASRSKCRRKLNG